MVKVIVTNIQYVIHKQMKKKISSEIYIRLILFGKVWNSDMHERKKQVKYSSCNDKKRSCNDKKGQVRLVVFGGPLCKI